MKLVDLYKTDNRYVSNWTTDYDSNVYIAGTIEPFTCHAWENDDGYLSLFILNTINNETEEESWCILNDIELNHLKSKL